MWLVGVLVCPQCKSIQVSYISRWNRAGSYCQCNFFSFPISTFPNGCVRYEQGPTLDAHTHGFWVGMGAMLLFMGGHGCDIIVHGWTLVLCIPASSSKSESNFSNAGNTLTKKSSELKPTTVNDLLFVRSNQDLM
jgi:hypothetical protein